MSTRKSKEHRNTEISTPEVCPPSDGHRIPSPAGGVPVKLDAQDLEVYGSETEVVLNLFQLSWVRLEEALIKLFTLPGSPPKVHFRETLEIGTIAEEYMDWRTPEEMAERRRLQKASSDALKALCKKYRIG